MRLKLIRAGRQDYEYLYFLSNQGSGTAGRSMTATLAKISGGGATDTYRVSVNWGDGATPAGTFTPATGGGLASGTHIYASPASYTVTTTVSSSNGTTKQTSSTATIASGP